MSTRTTGNQRGRVERLDRHFEQRGPFHREVFPTVVVRVPIRRTSSATSPARHNSFGQVLAHRHRDQMRSTKSSYLALDATLGPTRRLHLIGRVDNNDCG